MEEACFTSLQESSTGALASESNAAYFFFPIIEALCIMNSLPKARQSRFLSGDSETSVGCSMKKSDLKCGLQEAGYSVTIMHLLTRHRQLDNSWQNIQFLPFHLTSHLPTFSWSLNLDLPSKKISDSGRSHH
jgi:hypothetical protein